MALLPKPLLDSVMHLCLTPHHLRLLLAVYLPGLAQSITAYAWSSGPVDTFSQAVFSPEILAYVGPKRPTGDVYLDLAQQYPGEEMVSLRRCSEVILVLKPRLLADLLVHRTYDFVKPPNVKNLLRRVLGDGLVLVEGDQHIFLRKNIMPAFGFRHIKNLYPMMWAKALDFTKTLRTVVDEEPEKEGEKSSVVELGVWASRIALDIMGVAGIGREFHMLQNTGDPLLDAYHELLNPSQEILIYAMASFVFGVEFVQLLPWQLNGVFNNLTNSLNSISRTMIQDKRDAMTKKGDDHFDILSLLIKSNNFSDDELKDQLLTFLAAGHETTAAAISWTCYLLSKHAKMQSKLRAEVQEALPPGAFGGETGDISSILEQLPYLNGIINEALRLYPTVPITVRQATCDTFLGQQQVRKGTRILISMWLINRSPDIWGENADKFIPERWIEPNGRPNQTGGAASNYDFLTFLHGPRSCIGQGFAKAELRCLLAAMAASFSWELAMDESKILPQGVITIKPSKGLYLKLKPLDAHI